MQYPAPAWSFSRSLPASPSSPLANVSSVTFWAGSDVNALWTLPLSQPRPVWHAARFRARPQEPQAHLGRMPCAYGPFGDTWGSGSFGVLTVATLPAEDSQQPTLPSHLGPVLDSLGQSPHPLYFLTVPGPGFPTTSSVEQSRLLLGPGLRGVYLSLLGHWNSLSLHIADHFQREAGGMVLQRGQGRNGLRPSWVP